jgi:hypothetical protein
MGNAIPRELGELSRFQAGIISRQQALAAGLSTGAIVAKLRHERWQQIYRGVYATFTGPVNRQAQLWAAVLYAGQGARLSHETAAELQGLSDRRSSLIHVTIPPSRRVTSVDGVVIHISAQTDAGVRFPRGVVPRTFVEETILDLVHAARIWTPSAGG